MGRSQLWIREESHNRIRKIQAEYLLKVGVSLSTKEILDQILDVAENHPEELYGKLEENSEEASENNACTSPNPSRLSHYPSS